MAMTATISLSDSTPVTGQPVTAILTISNSGGSPVSMVAVNPYIQPTGLATYTENTAVALPSVNFGPNVTKVVTASGTLVITFPVVFHAPSTGYLNEGSDTFDVGATCYSDDGSVFKPTATTATVSYAVTFPESQQ